MTDQTEIQTAVDAHHPLIEISKRHNSIDREYSASAREIFLTLDALLVQWRNHANLVDMEIHYGVQDTLEAIRKARLGMPTFNAIVRKMRPRVRKMRPRLNEAYPARN
jgi:hypothetical protein